MRFIAVRIWVLLATAVLAAAPAAAAQDSIPHPAGNHLSVKVKAVATVLGSDTIRMNYILYNDSTSVQKAEPFLVRTDAKAVGQVGSPGMKLGWMASVGVLQDSASIQWFAANDPALVAPGDSAASRNAEQRRALQALRSGDLITACARMRDFLNRVERVSNTSITVEGRSLLRLNALHFRRRHCS